jgi:hypothetical protein
MLKIGLMLRASRCATGGPASAGDASRLFHGLRGSALRSRGPLGTGRESCWRHPHPLSAAFIIYLSLYAPFLVQPSLPRR